MGRRCQIRAKFYKLDHRGSNIKILISFNLRQWLLPFIGQESYVVPLPTPQPITKPFHKLPLNLRPYRQYRLYKGGDPNNFITYLRNTILFTKVHGSGSSDPGGDLSLQSLQVQRSSSTTFYLDVSSVVGIAMGLISFLILLTGKRILVFFSFNRLGFVKKNYTPLGLVNEVWQNSIEKILV